MPREYDEEDPEYQEEEEEEQPEDENPEEGGEEGEGEDDWAYSTCQGNKKALFVGIKYTGSAAPLNGCHNDVTNLHEFITSEYYLPMCFPTETDPEFTTANYGYDDAEIKILLDDDEDPETQPTRENILNALHWLVEGASQDDALFFHYSGHGGTQADTDGDEHDGSDETICPVDYEENGMIVDDDLHTILVKPLPKGCRLTVIFDACHSGTGMDLPYVYGPDGEIEDKQSADHKEFALENAIAAYGSGDDNVLALAARQMSLVASGGDDAAKQKAKRTKTHHADVVYLSGCQDIQYSQDAADGEGEATGVLSHAFITALSENMQMSYHELLVRIREFILEGGFKQIPQLSSSHPMDTSLTFII